MEIQIENTSEHRVRERVSIKDVTYCDVITRIYNIYTANLHITMRELHAEVYNNILCCASLVYIYMRIAWPGTSIV